MEKRKIDLSKYADMHEEKVLTGKDRTEISVRDHIPYLQKESMAREMAERLIVIHEDSCVYDSSEYDKIEKFEIAKYYTDIDTDDTDPADVADFMINNGMIGEIMKYIGDDFDEVRAIFWQLNEAVKTTYADDKSLTKALRTSFGFLFNGEDITESLAKAEAMKDTVYDAIGAWRKVEKEKEEKIDNGTLKVGGNIINFAKKQKTTKE